MQKNLERIASTWALLGGAILILIMTITSINTSAFILDRLLSVFSIDVRGLSGYEDFVRLAISCAALMFFPWCQFERGHIVVDLFSNLMPKSLVSFLRYFWRSMIVLLAVFLAYWMTIGMFEILDDNAKSPILGWPLWPFFIPGIISLILWAVIAAFQGNDSEEIEVEHHA